jgi:hypothetical protein
MADENYSWRDPRPLGGAVVVWEYVYLAATLASLAMVVLEFQALGGHSPQATVVGSGRVDLDMLTSVARTAKFAVQVITGVLFLKWIYRVTANARTLYPEMRAKPGWAVGWYFVPIAFLWKPFEYFKETWEVSHNPSSPAQVSTPGLLRWWWGLWLVSIITDNISGRLSMMDNSASMMRASDAFEIASHVFTLPLILVVVRILRRLSEQQGAGRSSAEVFA